MAQENDDAHAPTADAPPIGKRLTCTCGAVLEADDGEGLLAAVEAHVLAWHVPPESTHMRSEPRIDDHDREPERAALATTEGR